MHAIRDLCALTSGLTFLCVRCADGFYGDPLEIGGICRPCRAHCNDNINPDIPESCNTLTGECLICVGDTSGPRCQHCRDGFFGDAIQAKNCQSEFYKQLYKIRGDSQYSGPSSVYAREAIFQTSQSTNQSPILSCSCRVVLGDIAAK